MKKKTFLQAMLTCLAIWTLTSATGKNLFPVSGTIGECKLEGSVTYNPTTNTYLLTGAGTNMWLNSDEFFMACRKETGDFSLSAKVGFVGDGVDPHRKLGLIIRESFDADAKYADVCVHGDGLTSLQYRESGGDVTKEVVWDGKVPGHIVLERRGKRIIMKTAVGAYPEKITGEIELAFPDACYIGLFCLFPQPRHPRNGLFHGCKVHEIII